MVRARNQARLTIRISSGEMVILVRGAQVLKTQEVVAFVRVLSPEDIAYGSSQESSETDDSKIVWGNGHPRKGRAGPEDTGGRRLRQGRAGSKDIVYDSRKESKSCNAVARKLHTSSLIRRYASYEQHSYADTSNRQLRYDSGHFFSREFPATPPTTTDEIFREFPAIPTHQEIPFLPDQTFWVLSPPFGFLPTTSADANGGV